MLSGEVTKVSQNEEKMTIEQLIRRSVSLPLGLERDRTPADQISRQQWQETIEHLVILIREEFSSPAFGLTEAEISIHYHRPLDDFRRLIANKLGYKT